MCACVCVCQKKVSDPLDLELQVVVSHSTWAGCWKLNSDPLQDSCPLPQTVFETVIFIKKQKVRQLSIYHSTVYTMQLCIPHNCVYHTTVYTMWLYILCDCVYHVTVCTTQLDILYNYIVISPLYQQPCITHNCIIHNCMLYNGVYCTSIYSTWLYIAQLYTVQLCILYNHIYHTTTYTIQLYTIQLCVPAQPCMLHDCILHNCYFCCFKVCFLFVWKIIWYLSHDRCLKSMSIILEALLLAVEKQSGSSFGCILRDALVRFSLSVPITLWTCDTHATSLLPEPMALSYLCMRLHQLTLLNYLVWAQIWVLRLIPM